MKKKQINIEELKSRGLSCGRLKSMEQRQRNDASDFRKVGFENIARIEEQTAEKIKSLRNKVCLLK